VGVTRIESNRNRHFGLKIESKSIENRNLEIVTSLLLHKHYVRFVLCETVLILDYCSLVKSV